MSTAVVFAKVGDSLDKDRFLVPNVLKMVLCITPLVFAVVVKHERKCEGSQGTCALVVLSNCLAVDLFDAVEIIDIVLERQNAAMGVVGIRSLTDQVTEDVSSLISRMDMG